MVLFATILFIRSTVSYLRPEKWANLAKVSHLHILSGSGILAGCEDDALRKLTVYSNLALTPMYGFTELCLTFESVFRSGVDRQIADVTCSSAPIKKSHEERTTRQNLNNVQNQASSGPHLINAIRAFPTLWARFLQITNQDNEALSPRFHRTSTGLVLEWNAGIQWLWTFPNDLLLFITPGARTTPFTTKYGPQWRAPASQLGEKDRFRWSL